MSRRLALLNRLVVVVLGIILIGVAAYALAWKFNVPAIRELVSTYDRDAVTAAPVATWWPWLLAVVLAASLIGGIVLLTLDLTRRRPHAVTLVDGESGSVVTVDLESLAEGVAGELRAFEGVRSVRGRAVLDGGLPTLALTVTAHPSIDVVEFTETAEEKANWITATLAGRDQQSAVAVLVQLHLAPADQRPPADDAERSDRDVRGAGSIRAGTATNQG